MTLPRGIRSNNPGNIRVGDPWQGLMPRDQMNDAQKREKEFCVFSEPKWGIRALCRLLIAYKDKHKLDTVSKIITRWAPPNGKVGSKTYTQNTAGYIAHVCSMTGFGPDEKVDVYRFEVIRPLSIAIMKHETGLKDLPYDDDTINEGIRLAGIEVPVKPLSQSREIKGQQVAAGGLLGSVAAEAAAGLSDAAGMLQPLIAYADTIKWVFIGLTLAGIIFTMWARMRVNAEGVR
jgi:hypothetical protein